jgi:hypothetical protein
MEYATRGMVQGGVAGGAKAAVGIAASTALEFFGVNDVWRAGAQAEAGQYVRASGTLIFAVAGNLPGGKIAANLRRTVKGAQGADVTVSTVGRFHRASWEVAGEGGGQSRTVWNKIINEQGETIRLYKDSYDRAGKFQHRKFKVPDEHRSN